MAPRTRKQHQAQASSQALPRPMVTRSSRPQQSQQSSQPVSMPPPPGLGGMEMPPPPSHTEGEKAQEELKRNIVEYRAFLESCDFIEANTQWRKVQDRLEDDERCSKLDKTDRLKIFQEYLHDLEKEEEQKIQKEQLRQKERKNRDEFRRLMADHQAIGLLTTKTHWLDYYAKVKDHPSYLAVASNTSGPPPKDLFEDVAEEMEKKFLMDTEAGAQRIVGSIQELAHGRVDQAVERLLAFATEGCVEEFVRCFDFQGWPTIETPSMLEDWKLQEPVGESRTHTLLRRVERAFRDGYYELRRAQHSAARAEAERVAAIAAREKLATRLRMVEEWLVQQRAQMVALEEQLNHEKAERAAVETRLITAVERTDKKHKEVMEAVFMVKYARERQLLAERDLQRRTQ